MRELHLGHFLYDISSVLLLWSRRTWRLKIPYKVSLNFYRKTMKRYKETMPASHPMGKIFIQATCNNNIDTGEKVFCSGYI